MVCGLALRWRMSRSVKNACTVAAIAVTVVLQASGRGGGPPRPAVPGRHAGTSRCWRARCGRGRPTAVASASRYRRRRGTSPANWRPRMNAEDHAAVAGAAGQPGEGDADVVIQQSGADAGHEQRLADRAGERL